MNSAMMKAVIVQHNETQTILADAMGMAQSALNARINGKTDFRQKEIEFIRKRYHLSQEVSDLIFFDEIVSETDTSKGA
jgi:DNA-binding transcriptional regulator YiaG